MGEEGVAQGERLHAPGPVFREVYGKITQFLPPHPPAFPPVCGNGSGDQAGGGTEGQLLAGHRHRAPPCSSLFPAQGRSPPPQARCWAGPLRPYALRGAARPSVLRNERNIYVSLLSILKRFIKNSFSKQKKG